MQKILINHIPILHYVACSPCKKKQNTYFPLMKGSVVYSRSFEREVIFCSLKLSSLLKNISL